MKAPPGDKRPPLAVAMEWVSRITTVVAEMVLPGLAGQWLDNRWGTTFIALIGFSLGLTAWIPHFVAMTRPRQDRVPPRNLKADDATGSVRPSSASPEPKDQDH